MALPLNCFGMYKADPVSLASINAMGVFNRFWKRAGFVPLYLRQTTSELTGEHTCVMVRLLNSSIDDEVQWLGEFAKGLSIATY